MQPLIIIGSGLAGYTTAREWRRLDPDSPLTIITADDGRSYSKPMLSNALAKGATPDALAMADAAQMAERLDAEILTHTRVHAIAPREHQVSLDSGTRGYAQLVLALGADPIRLPLDGDAADDVMSVNDLEDYARFRQAIAAARHVTIIGAGLIGCEFANDLLSAGLEVAVVEPAAAPLGRLVPEAAGRALAAALADIGVRWQFGTTVATVDRQAAGYRVRLANGTAMRTDAVLSAVGLRPRSALAAAAELAVARGIVTDSQLRTSMPDIYALGDCAEVGGFVLPFVMPLMNAARALARTLAGEPTPVRYPAMPVAVKTPAHPVVVSPPPPGVNGEWQVDTQPTGVHGLFYDSASDLRGFALTGTAVAEKAALAKRLPPLLG